MRKYLLLTMLTTMLAACAGHDGKDGSNGLTGPQGPAITPPSAPATDSVQDDITALVKDENDYRLGLGQTTLASGLSCVLYTVTGGDRIQASVSGHNTLTGLVQVASYTYKGVFNQPDSPASDGMNALPPALRSIYTNMYLLRCQGQLVVRESGMIRFDLLSDDGSVLYIDGSKLVDNDNNHGIVLASGQKNLRRGVHTFRLDYAQTGAGSQALILKWNDSILDPMYLFH